MTHRVFTTPLADVYSLCAATLERKGRSKRELDQVILYLDKLVDGLAKGRPLDKVLRS